MQWQGDTVYCLWDPLTIKTHLEEKSNIKSPFFVSVKVRDGLVFLCSSLLPDAPKLLRFGNVHAEEHAQQIINQTLSRCFVEIERVRYCVLLNTACHNVLIVDLYNPKASDFIKIIQVSNNHIEIMHHDSVLRMLAQPAKEELPLISVLP